MSVFDSFTPLEDLIQAIYQGFHRFVLLSKVDFDSIEPSWKVYLGLADGGRWWKGKWLEKDLHDFIVSTSTLSLYEYIVKIWTLRTLAGKQCIIRAPSVLHGEHRKYDDHWRALRRKLERRERRRDQSLS